jgi:serine/threonine protein kinase
LIRDTQPDNILVVEDAEDGEQAKVVDFGIAKILESKSPLGDSLRTDNYAGLGTALYMAPERFEGAPGDPRMDVYALGLLLHELLSGLLPFAKRYEDREDGTVLLHKRFTEEIPPLSLTQPISPQLQALLRQMLARDAAVRPAHAGMVRERFRDIPEIQAISSTLPERSGQMVIPSSALSGGAEGQTTSATVSALSLVERGTLFPVLLALTIVATLLTFAYLLFGPPHS